jgi:replicative DNA helicase
MDELRRSPHNIEAEQAVIGSMLLDPRCIPGVMELLNGEDFYLTAHQNIFEAMQVIFGSSTAFDPVTLQGKMREMGTFDESSTADYIHRLMDNTPTAAHIKHYTELVRRQSLLRKLDGAASDISGMAREPGAMADDVLDAAEQRVYDIRRGRELSVFHKMPEVLTQVYKNVKAISDSGGKLPGISYGIPRLDEILGGMLNGNLIIIASRPGVGKTSLMLGLALNAARVSGKKTAFFSLEMPKEQLVARLLSAEANIDSRKLQRGSLSPDEWKRMGEATGSLSALPILFDDSSAISVEAIKGKCRPIGAELGLVIVDYLQLVDVPKGKGIRFDNRVSEVGHISRSLKNMSKDLGVPVICAAQLRRASESNKSGRPMLSDLRESGNIEQDADSVMLIHREWVNNPEADPNLAECIIAKNRHGPAGNIVKLHWSRETTSFTQLEDQNEYDS